MLPSLGDCCLFVMCDSRFLLSGGVKGMLMDVPMVDTHLNSTSFFFWKFLGFRFCIFGDCDFLFRLIESDLISSFIFGVICFYFFGLGSRILCFKINFRFIYFKLIKDGK